MLKYTIRVLFLLSAVGLIVPTVWGQAESSSADLTGTIYDSSKAVLGGATIVVVNLETMLSRTTTSDKNGVYRISLLSPGAYEIKVQAAGFKVQVKRGITLTVGQTAVINFDLTLGVRAETEVIEIETPLIEIERTHQSSTITQRAINNLPINGRNFLDFARLTPGVVEESPVVQKIQVPQLQTSGLSFAGQNGRSNSIQIDGVDQNDIASNGVRPTISQEAVREFQINRLGYNAEFGRASAGIINIVSKSGSNQFHGTVYDYFRNESLDARNIFASSNSQDSPFKRNQPGFSVGGPVQRDKTFFFVSSEGLIRRESAYTTILADPSILKPTAAQQDLINALAGFGGAGAMIGQQLQALLTTAPDSPLASNRATYNFLNGSYGAFPLEETSSTSSVRFDHAFSEKNYLFLRYGFTNDSQHSVGIGGLLAPSAGYDIGITDHTVVLGQTHLFESGASNDFRFQFVRNGFNVNTVDPYGPRLVLAGIATFGRSFDAPSDRLQYREQVLDNFSIKRGRNNIKFGGDFNRYSFDVFTPIFGGGQIDFTQLPITLSNVLDPTTYNNLVMALQSRPDLIQLVNQQSLTTVQQLNLGLPRAINQGFGDPNVSATGSTLGLYLQDGVQVKPNLYLNLGLRYDYEFQPAGTPRDGNNIGPRIGFTYDPFKDGKTVIRGGAGLYYQSLFTATTFVSRVLAQGQISNILVSADPTQQVDPNSPCGMALTPTGNPVPPLACFYQALLGLGYLSGTGMIPEAAYAQLLGLTRQTSTNRVIIRLDNNAVDPYGFQGSFGIDREIGKDWSISANYMVNHGVKLIRIRQANAVAATTDLDAFGRPALTGRVDPTRLADYVYETAGNSTYHGLTVSVNRRFARHYQLIGSYTFGRAIDDTTDLNFEQAPQDPTNSRAERGLSSFSVSHRLSMASLFESPFEGGKGKPFYQRLLADFYISPIVTIRSGFPFNVLTGVDINMDNNNNDRPFAVGRNTGMGPGFFAADLRLGRRFRFGNEGQRSLELILDAFNLFNRVNYKDVNNNTGGILYLDQLGYSDVRITGCSDRPANAFCGFTSAYDPRILQLAVRVNF